jgi:hypothetical protein
MLWRSMAAGVIATLSLDVFSLVSSRLQLSAPLPPNLIGRWFAFIARGTLLHADIASTPRVPNEIGIALPVHYAIGIVLTGMYIWTVSSAGRSPRNLALALAFGLSTNVLPWLLMFPAMGYGFFGSHGPEGTRLFLSSLINHAFFGIGIWLGVMAAGLR